MFELVEEMFRATKPGLSAFADEPQKVMFKKIYLHRIFSYSELNLYYSLLCSHLELSTYISASLATVSDRT